MDDFPGYLGWTSKGVIAIHANWPAYPFEHGWPLALVTLGAFPQGTEFRPLDDIDRCILFVVRGTEAAGPRGEFSEDASHVALWHEDLIELAERGLVRGVEGITQRQWDVFGGSSYGAGYEAGFRPRPPVFVEDEEEEEYRSLFARIFDDVVITTAGWREMDRLLGDSLELPPEIQDRINLLLQAELFDTAIREMSLAVETKLRTLTRSNRYGQKLVEEAVQLLAVDGAVRSSFLKPLRIELRAMFRFVRNEFAHNFVEIPGGRALAILSRLGGLMETLDDLSLPS